MKRGQGLSMNTIVIAAIALVVLFVVILIFRGVADRPGQLYNACGEGIYAELDCVPADEAQDSSLCVGALDCVEEHGEGARCCPVDEG